MSIEFEVMEGGILKLLSPELPAGTKFTIEDGVHINTSPEDGAIPPEEGNKNWESLKEALDEAKKLDIPRRTHEEILHDLHDFRERE